MPGTLAHALKRQGTPRAIIGLLRHPESVLIGNGTDVAHFAELQHSAVSFSGKACASNQSIGWLALLCRLQQLQGKSVVVPPGAPAAMADTSKLLELIEGLTATAPDTGALPAAPPAQPAAGAAAGRLSSAASAAAPARASASGAKGAPAAPVMSKAEQVMCHGKCSETDPLCTKSVSDLASLLLAQSSCIALCMPT